MKTNQDVVRTLSTRELAGLFVYELWQTEYDYDEEGNRIGSIDSSYCKSTLIDGRWADIIDATDAVEKYLNAETDEDWEYELRSRERDDERAVS